MIPFKQMEFNYFNYQVIKTQGQILKKRHAEKYYRCDKTCQFLVL